ncbi:uncharacterized protein BYT42DRAFT_611866 [Radiomyces spectabilis]|uniref:uncharacterized protein n=1 Tax=Radiomyces spectabilis TaxID=64574 RepID=UPI00221EF913|nr:uncharacterized protein BYT42DRAFT_611866 [Radiomyces spectabilis]KAI8388874.1 hypothetical protein BYT42DRAFT_611866 [Radiomyces spectabilis]
MRIKISTCAPLPVYNCWHLVDNDRLDPTRTIEIFTVRDLKKEVVHALRLPSKSKQVALDMGGFQLLEHSPVKNLIRDGDLITVRLTEQASEQSSPIPKKRKQHQDLDQTTQEKAVKIARLDSSVTAHKKKKKEKATLPDTVAKTTKKKDDKEEKLAKKTKSKDQEKKKAKLSDKTTGADKKSEKKQKSKSAVDDKGSKKDDKRKSIATTEPLATAKPKSSKPASPLKKDKKPSKSQVDTGDNSERKFVVPPYQGSKKTQERNRRRALKKKQLREKSANDDVTTLSAPSAEIEKLAVKESTVTNTIEPHHLLKQNKNKKKNFLKDMSKKPRMHVVFEADHDVDDAPTAASEAFHSEMTAVEEVGDELDQSAYAQAIVTQNEADYNYQPNDNPRFARQYPVHSVSTFFSTPVNYQSQVESEITNISQEDGTVFAASEETGAEMSNDGLVPATEPKVEKVERNYDDYPSLSFPTTLPKPGDIIAFMTLELSESYTPQISDWKEAKVIAVDNNDQHLIVKYESGFEVKRAAGGKFDLLTEDENEEETVTEMDDNITLSFETVLHMKTISD